MSDESVELLRRICKAVERMAGIDPPEARQRKKAILGTAAYSENERERLRLKEELRKAEKSKRKNPSRI